MEAKLTEAPTKTSTTDNFAVAKEANFDEAVAA